MQVSYQNPFNCTAQSSPPVRFRKLWVTFPSVQTQQFKQLTNAVMEGVEAGRSNPEFLALSAQLLQNNPDVYTVWNHRRRALQDVLKVNSCTYIAIESFISSPLYP